MEMSSVEYLDQLERLLVGRIDPDELGNILDYYKNYIRNEMTKGKTEEEVIKELDEPRFLAKSILAAQETSGYGENVSDYSEESDAVTAKGMPLWVAALLGILAVVIILVLFVTLLSALLPIALPVIFVVMIVSFFMKRKGL